VIPYWTPRRPMTRRPLISALEGCGKNVNFFKIRLSTHGILRCRQVDACRFQISSKNKRTADLNLKNSTTSKKNSTTSQKNLTTSQKNLTTSPTPNATSPSTTSVHGRTATGGQGLSKVSPGPAMTYPAGRPPLKRH
jgi:hypothetical protein